jgi:hypothetical protein
LFSFRIKKNSAKYSPSFTFLRQFTLTETPVCEYNRIEGLYHEFHDETNAIPEPAHAGVEGGWVEFISPDKSNEESFSCSRSAGGPVCFWHDRHGYGG